MRIQTLSERTNISKRNIHFYIKEGLLCPKVNDTNGYYDFSEEDFKRLMLIKNFRYAGFSVSSIRSLLNTPASTEYHLRMRLGRVEQEIELLHHTSSTLSDLLKKLPVNPDFTTLYNLITEEDLHENQESIPMYDGFLVNHFLWRVYWQDENLTEYQQFLWEKINRITDSREKNENYAKLYDYLCSQNEKKIATLYAERNHHFNYVAGFSEDTVLDYAEEMKKAIENFIHTPFSVKQWKDHYHSFIIPQMKIYTSDIGRIAEEMSPFFGAYKQNSTKACVIVYQWLHTSEGKELLKEIESVLSGYVNLEHCNHAELESMNTVFKY